MRRLSKDRERFIIIFIFTGINFILGGLAGWCVRTTTMNHRLQTATLEAWQAERDYYQKEAQQIIKEAQTKISKEKKHGSTH